jgi:hypothetical protein
MTDKTKIEILKKIQDYRDRKITADVETFQKEEHNIGTINVMVSEGLINMGGTTLSLTPQGDKVLRENLTIEGFSKQQEKAVALTTSLAEQSNFIKNSLEQTLKASDYLKSVSESIKGLSFPIRDIQLALPALKQIRVESELISQIAKSQEWVSRLGSLAELSNLSKIALAIPQMPVFSLPIQEITPKFLNDSKDELFSFAEELEDEKDPVYNVEAYEALFNLEVSLRKLIQERIIIKFSKQLEQKLPPEMIADWERKKKEEESNAHVDKSEYNLIDFSDFTDLKRIFEKGRNRELFYDLVNEQDFNAVISKLHELDPIRKKIAHSRLLTETEFKMVEMYNKQITRLLTKKA